MANNAVASTSYAQLAFIEETELGVTPTTGKGAKLRMTGESLEQTISKEVSAEINSTRQTSGMFLTDAQVGGDFNIELSAEEYDPFFEGVLMDDWKDLSAGLDVGDATLTATGSKIKLATPPPNLADVAAGTFASIRGTGEPLNKGPFLIVSATADTLTVANKLVNETISGAKMRSGRVMNGVKKRSYTLSKEFSDVSQFFTYRGMRPARMSLSFESQAAITGSFGFVGMNMQNTDTTQLPALEESKAHPIMDAVLGMSGVYWDGEDIRKDMTAGVRQITLEYDNNLRPLDAIGVLGAVDVMVGSISCSGTISMYFVNGQAYEDTIRQKRISLSWVAYDNNGRGYAFTLPSIELTEPSSPAGSKDEPVMMDISFQGLMDPVLRKTIIIDRF